MATNARCDIFHGEDEDLDYLFRKCSRARIIWSARQKLDDLCFADWLSRNLRGKVINKIHQKWETLFAVTVWWLWKLRNEAIFKGREWDVAGKIQWIIHQNTEITVTYSKCLKPGTMSTSDDAKRLNWTPPQPGWIVLNTDAGCGGAMRDSSGDWIAGFSCMAKVNSITEAECWAVMKVLQWAWGINYKKIWVQCDSKDVEWLNKSESPIGPLGNMVKICKDWIWKPWEVKVSHVFKEQNEVVDGLAKITVGINYDWIEFFGHSDEVRNLVHDERSGVRSSRSHDVSRH